MSTHNHSHHLIGKRLWLAVAVNVLLTIAQIIGGIMWIKRISADFVKTVLHEAQDPRNKDMFQVHVLDPIIQYALGRLFPYILVTSIVFILTFILAVAILVMIMNK